VPNPVRAASFRPSLAASEVADPVRAHPGRTPKRHRRLSNDASKPFSGHAFFSEGSAFAHAVQLMFGHSGGKMTS
jgi:hypothetical protein